MWETEHHHTWEKEHHHTWEKEHHHNWAILADSRETLADCWELNSMTVAHQDWMQTNCSLLAAAPHSFPVVVEEGCTVVVVEQLPVPLQMDSEHHHHSLDSHRRVD
jgi:uncharacterized protein (DUF1684 family)